MNYDIGDLARVCTNIMSQLDVVTNNLANLSTPGFKVEYWRGDGEDAGDKSTTGNGSSMYVDYSQGILQQTDNALDIAMQGEGFFVIETRNGTAYTRKGNFTLNQNKQLATRGGEILLGEGGPITIQGRNVEIDREGVVQVDGIMAGKLRIVAFDKPQKLIRQGEGLYTDSGTAGLKKVVNPDVSARHLEMANVNAIKEMANMIDIQRSFETYQKVILTISDMDKLSTSRIGRLA